VERVRITIIGRVQGVFYRKSLQERALKLKIRGWVQNLPDGNVEAIMEGEKVDLEQLIAWSRIGPSGAKVERVSCEWQRAQNDLVGFKILHI